MTTSLASHFLAFRRFMPIDPSDVQTYIDTAGLLAFLRSQRVDGQLGIALSGGMDGAIVAATLRPSLAYTLAYDERDAEVDEAAQIAREVGASLRVVRVTREQFFRTSEMLIDATHRPVIPHAALIHLLAREARQDGCTAFATGSGAHGEWPQFYAAAHSVDALMRAWFRVLVNPARVLRDPVDVRPVFARYERPDGTVDVQRMIREVGTEGDGAERAIEAAGLAAVMPLRACRFAGQYDPQAFGRATLKPHVSEAFRILFGRKAPPKAALPAPYRAWMEGYAPTHPMWSEGASRLTGKRLFLVWSIERWMRHRMECSECLTG